RSRRVLLRELQVRVLAQLHRLLQRADGSAHRPAVAGARSRQASQARLGDPAPPRRGGGAAHAELAQGILRPVAACPESRSPQLPLQLRTHAGGLAGPMSERSAGRAVVELLKAEQVRYIFGIVGSTFLDVLDALYDDRSVEYINVRHEQAAAFMADGLARVTDVPGVCLVTSGPGATNLLTGVAAAHVAHSPVLVLVGGVDLDHHGKDAFQDYDLVSMFRPVTKLAVQVPTPGRIPEMLRAALRAAMTGRRADLLLVMGSRLGHFTSHFDSRYIRPDTAIIQIDVDSGDVGRYYQTAIGIQADAREACLALLDTLGRDTVSPSRQAWRQEVEVLRVQRQARLTAEGGLQATPMKPQRVYAELRRALPPETIVALDAGAAPAYGYDRLHFSRPRTFLTPLDLGGRGLA